MICNVYSMCSQKRWNCVNCVELSNVGLVNYLSQAIYWWCVRSFLKPKQAYHFTQNFTLFFTTSVTLQDPKLWSCEFAWRQLLSRAPPSLGIGLLGSNRILDCWWNHPVANYRTTKMKDESGSNIAWDAFSNASFMEWLLFPWVLIMLVAGGSYLITSTSNRLNLIEFPQHNCTTRYASWMEVWTVCTFLRLQRNKKSFERFFSNIKKNDEKLMAKWDALDPRGVFQNRTQARFKLKRPIENNTNCKYQRVEVSKSSMDPKIQEPPYIYITFNNNI